MTEAVLDLDLVCAFLLIADYGNLTRAAEAMLTTQAAVNLKLNRLEARLGCRTNAICREVRAGFRGRGVEDMGTAGELAPMAARHRAVAG